ncbi:phosphate propanoyltransferase [Heliobacterium gestii]|uniref:Phosphate propanoyltransferase n=2 Tax=Heliomicrobium gestii TaxID=2699 RepID=A0A845LFY6_HELGE|nr:phosphate propanoyltransferase [Heliomicrobium gestii]
MEQIITQVVLALQERFPNGEAPPKGIPVGVSNRHLHLSTADAAILFGEGHPLTKIKDLKQEGEFAAEETVTLIGPKGVLRGVRVLGPLRGKTQVEISLTDSFSLGIKAPIRDSGQTQGSPGISIAGPCGVLMLRDGVIVAARHIHMSPAEADAFRLHDQDRVNIETFGPRGVIFKNVLIRVHPKFRLEMHLDVDEANAAGLKNNDAVYLYRQE